MKRTEKEFKQYVKDLRRMVPAYSNGRRVLVFGEDTKQGQKVIAMGSAWIGDSLGQVYNKWSDAKQKAYDQAVEMYSNSRHGTAFGICSANAQNFTVSWLSDDGLTVLTRATEYLIIFNE